MRARPTDEFFRATSQTIQTEFAPLKPGVKR